MGRPRVTPFDWSPATTGTRRAACRVALSALACGLAAVGMGGALSPGALGASVPGGTPVTPSAAGANGAPATAPPSGGASTPPQPVATQPTTQPPSTRAVEALPGATHVPIVRLEGRQRTTAGYDAKPTSGHTTGAGRGPSGQSRGKLAPRPPAQRTGAGQPASTPSDVAPPPQVLAGQAEGLAAAVASSAASVQALGFYRVPLFLLPIYQAAAAQYGVPWQILAAINEIETDYGTDQSVSSAGAVGWMQFMPATWLGYGVDALDAGYADPYNPVDAIFAAARYLRAAAAATDLHAAILAYNHSEEYVSSVLLRAKLISSYPKPVVATLTGLIDGRLPVTGRQLAWAAAAPALLPPLATGSATAAGAREASSGVGAVSARPGSVSSGRSSTPGSSPAIAPAAAAAAVGTRTVVTRARPLRLFDLISAPNASVVAVQEGRIVRFGESPRLGKYLVLRDVYGDLFTYAGLGSLARTYVLPKAPRPPVKSPLLQAAGAGGQLPLTIRVKEPAGNASQRARTASARVRGVDPAEAPPAGMGRVRLFARPGNPDALAAATLMASLAPRRHVEQPLRLRLGSVVASGTVLGRVRVPRGARDGHLRFAIQPAGDPGTIDPGPVLANWGQLAAALHPQGARAEDALLGATAAGALLMSKEELEAAVLSDPGITLDACGRRDIASGELDRRALAVLAFLSRSGLEPSVTGLPCHQGPDAPAGPRSLRQERAAFDISAVDGVAIAGHQGAGTITDVTIRTLLTLPSEFLPHEIISLMRYPGAPRTHARPDHGADIEIEYVEPRRGAAVGSTTTTPVAHSAGTGESAPSPLLASPDLTEAEWDSLIARIGALAAPKVSRTPSSSAIRDPGGL